MGLLDFLSSADDDEEKRKRSAASGGLLGAPEEPSAMARVGRGMTDIGEMLAQAYYNAKVWDPKQADDYKQQRAEDERLYQKGRNADNPLPPELQGMMPDLLRLAGQSAALVPFWTAGGLLQAGKGVPPLFQAAVQGPITAEAWREATYFPELYKYMSTLDGPTLMRLLQQTR